MAATDLLSPHGLTVRRYDRDRFVTSLFAPPARRDDLFTLFAFNLEIARIRETVREAMLGQIRLQWWRDALDQLWAGHTVGHPVADNLGDMLRRRPLPRALFDQLVDARDFDMLDRPPDNAAALDDYVTGSAASLTRLAAALLDGEDADTQAAAAHVGQAWGLIGLLRAHAFHIKMRRLFVPADWLETHGLDREELFAGAAPRALAEWALQIADHAADHLRRARGRRKSVARTALPALLPAKLADGYLKALSRVGYNITDRDWSAVNSRPITLLSASLLGRY